MKINRLVYINCLGSLCFLLWTIRTTEAFLNCHKYKPTAIKTTAWTTTSQLAWSRSAEYLENEDEEKKIDIQDMDRTKSSLSSSPSRLYNLSSPREWLEKQEEDSDIPGGGAYTVIRCDFCIPRMKPNDNNNKISESTKNKGRWKIWGKDFHMNRLRQSYQLLLDEYNSDDNYSASDEALDVAKDETWDIVQVLLSNARDEGLDEVALSADSPTSAPADDDDEEDSLTLMVTLLWQPSSNLDSSLSKKIKIKGHACTLSTTFNSIQSYDPAPITACVAIESYHDNHLNQTPALPNRYENIPEAKLSSWCRRRRPLEEQFKVHGVGEVLLTAEKSMSLVSSSSDNAGESYNNGNNNVAPAVDREDIHMLEGLTSNFFVIYPNGKLRTDNSDVLKGYARDLVISCAERCGLQVELNDGNHPIKLSDAPMWEEAFITSSVSIIKPIEKILLPPTDKSNPLCCDGGSSMHVLWSSKNQSENNDNANDSLPKWKALYKEIIKATE